MYFIGGNLSEKRSSHGRTYKLFYEYPPKDSGAVFMLELLNTGKLLFPDRDLSFAWHDRVPVNDLAYAVSGDTA